MNKFTTSLLVLLFIALGCSKQESKSIQEDILREIPVIAERKCASNEVFEEQLAANPKLRKRMDDIEAYTHRVMQNPGAYRIANGTITIPIVVHVVYNRASQNISDDQVNSQLAVLNEDFHSQNADKVNLPSSFQSAASTGLDVNFVLAQPVIHKSTRKTSFSTNDGVKSSKQGGDDPIDPEHKLNIWVCNLGGGLLGYAQFPGGQPETDGVVILYSAFGSRKKYPTGTYTSRFDRGRTATHEVGHWMNLRHIWGDDGGKCTGSDLIADTPNQGTYNVGIPTYPHISCSNGPTGDMFMNYMDYTDDAGMYMFSKLQTERMLSVFSSGGARENIVIPR